MSFSKGTFQARKTRIRKPLVRQIPASLKAGLRGNTGTDSD